MGEAGFHVGARREAQVATGGFDVGVGGLYVTCLHRQEPLVGLTLEEPFQHLDEVEQGFRPVVAEIVECERRLTVVRLGRTIDRRQDARNDIVDIGEVALHIAAVEDLDRPTVQNLLGEAPIGHVRAPPRSIDRKEPQAGKGQSIEMGIGVSQQFRSPFAGGIDRHRPIDPVLDREGKLTVRAIDGGGAGKEKVAQLRKLQRRLLQCQLTKGIRLQVDIGIFKRIAHAGLGGQVHDLGDFRMAGYERQHLFAIGNVQAREGETAIPLQLGETRLLKGRLVIVVEVVDPDNRTASST